MDKNYRYPGTKPFQEKDSHLFFGRTTEKINLSELIVLETLVVLFGKSGYGKTSLLNAAVIPRLRRFEKHLVYNVRLLEAEQPDQVKRDPLEVLLTQLRNESDSNSFIKDKLNIPELLSEDITAQIWYYAKILQLKNKDRKAITLIFDQFEELGQFKDEQIDAFGRCIGKLLNLNAPKSVRRLIEKMLDSNESYFSRDEVHDLLKPLNLKVVMSLHHDRLSLLHQLKQFLPTIFKYTYELKPLSEKQARIAFLKPATVDGNFASPEFTYTEEATSFIFEYLEDSKNHLIEPFQLQLIGQHAEECAIDKNKNAERKANLKAKFSRQKEDAEKAKIELGVKDLGKPETIFKKHYQKVISSLPIGRRPKVRNLIETVLIMEGNRVPMPEIAIINRHDVTKKSLEDLRDKRLLRSELNTVQDTSYEISHDSLVKPILESAERRKRRRLWILVISGFLAIIAGLLSRIYYLETEPTNGIIINSIAVGRVSPYAGEAPLDVKFIFKETRNLDSIWVTEYSWDFGDGKSSSNIDSVWHTYSKVDNYKVLLTVKDNNGRERFEEYEIIVREPTSPIDTIKPKVSISPSTFSGQVPLEVNFSGKLSPDNIPDKEYLWEFMDSLPSNEARPIHTFNKKGTYDVRLTISDTLGKEEYENIVVITVLDTLDNDVIDPANKSPVAKIWASQYGGKPGVAISFHGKASSDDRGITEYHWEFNDGGSSPEDSVTHTFNKIRNYNVRLTVWDEGRLKGTDSVEIKVVDKLPPPPLAGITVTDTVGIAPLEVTFNGSNANDDGSPIIYEWKFPNGRITNEVNPTHIFALAGTYNVQLSVTDSFGQPGTNRIRITVKPPIIPEPPILPIAVAEADSTRGIVPLKVSFNGKNDNENGSESSYKWSIKDSTISTEQNPVIEFKKRGEYDVLLTVTSNNLKDSTSVNIIVEDPPPLQPPVVIANVVPNPVKVGEKVTFKGSESSDPDGTISSYQWNFGDGNFSFEADPGHSFNTHGPYNVELTVTDNDGLSAAKSIIINVEPKTEPEPIDPIDEYITWFKRVNSIKRSKDFNRQKDFNNFDQNQFEKDSNYLPKPDMHFRRDTTHLVGIVIEDGDNSEFKGQALLLLLIKGKAENGYKENKVFKFRVPVVFRDTTEVETGINVPYALESFSLLGSRDARKEEGASSSTAPQYYIKPGDTTATAFDKEINAYLKIFELAKGENKKVRLSKIVYSLLPKSEFEPDAQKEIDELMALLKPQ